MPNTASCRYVHIHSASRCVTQQLVVSCSMVRAPTVLHLHLPIMRLPRRRPVNSPHHPQTGVHPLFLATLKPLWTHTLHTGTSLPTSLPIYSSSQHATSRFKFPGHSLGTTSIHHSLKNGRQVNNNNIASTMLSRGTALVVRLMHLGHLRQTGWRSHHRHHRLHSPSPGPGSAHTGLDPRFGAGRGHAVIVVMIFFSSLLYVFNVYFLSVPRSGRDLGEHAGAVQSSSRPVLLRGWLTTGWQ